MPAVQIQASFKKDESQYDGLASHVEDMVKNPLTPLVIVAVAEVSKLIEDPRDGTVQPKIKIKQIELCTEADAIAATNLLQRIYGQRTGRDDSQPSLFDSDQAGQTGQDHPAQWPGTDTTALEEPAAPAEPKKRGRPRRTPAAPVEAEPVADAPSTDPWATTDGGASAPEQSDDGGATAPWPGDVDFRPPTEG